MRSSGLIAYLESLATYTLYRCGCLSTPTDLDRIAATLGVIEICYEPMIAEGCVEAAENGYRIRLRENAPAVRQRFSFAHEIGHVLIEKICGNPSSSHYKRFRAYSKVATTLDEESMADYLAGFLLLPSQVLVEGLGGKLEIRRIERVAQNCQVSLSTALLRTMHVATQPCAAFMIQGGLGRPARLMWCRRSASAGREIESALRDQAIINGLFDRDEPGLQAVDEMFSSVQLRSRAFGQIRSVFGLAIV